MDCREAREHLTRPPGPQLCDDRLEAALAHARSCPDCAPLIAPEVDPAELCAALRREEAPLSVRRKVLDQVALARAERAGLVESGAAPRRRRGGGFGLAFAGFGLLLLTPGGESVDVDPMLQEEARREAGLSYIRTSDRVAVSAFISRELDRAVPESALAALEVLEAEACDLDGVRAVVVTYRYGDYRLSHYFSATEEGRRAPVVATDPAPGARAAVTWDEGGLRNVLVGRVDSKMLLGMGRVILREMVAAEYANGAGLPEEPDPVVTERRSS